MATKTKSQPSPFRVGLKTRVFNYSLDKALKQAEKRYAMPRYRLAPEVLEITVAKLYGYLQFKAYPKLELRLQIALALEVHPDTIFPEELEHQRVDQPDVVTMTRSEWEETRLLSGSGYGGIDQAEDRLMAGNLTEVVDDALDTLYEREAHILQLRFGIIGGQPRTLDETADYINNYYGTSITRERIRQIEARGLRKLRQPSRSKQLRPYLDDYQD